MVGEDPPQERQRAYCVCVRDTYCFADMCLLSTVMRDWSIVERYWHTCIEQFLETQASKGKKMFRAF